MTRNSIDHSNHHSYHYQTVQFNPSYWVDEDDNTISLRMDSVDSLYGEDTVLWAMAHVTFVLTPSQLEQLAVVVDKALKQVKPQPEVDDLIRNAEESEGKNYDALKGLLY